MRLASIALSVLVIYCADAFPARVFASTSKRRAANSCQRLILGESGSGGLKLGQGVRFRGSDLHMRDGRLSAIDVSTRTVSISSDTGTASVPFDGVFRVTRLQRSRTPNVNFWWSVTKASLSPTVLAFLNNAARIIGEEERRGSDADVILRTTIRYVQSRMTADGSVAIDPPASLDQSILSRRAACLQYALIGGLIFAEAGYDVSIVTHHPDTGAGHAWLEVSLPTNDGVHQTYVVDMSWDHPYVATLGQVSRAIQNGGGIEKFWYANAGRKYFKL